MLRPLRIGHVVLKVRDLDRSLLFYRDLLGFRVVSELSNVMIFLSAGGDNHHDLALLRVGQQAPSPLPTAVGLYHVAVQLADWDAVRAAHALLTERGLLKGAIDHGVSRSLYTADPDGNEIELYCDAPRAEWEGRVDEVMTVKPLVID
ncbi:MAG TPA: VOC family protein [Candidatus Limnocylindria bacterium]|nr:VOC family protein [Candidatus Limnocylindria bacterium]